MGAKHAMGTARQSIRKAQPKKESARRARFQPLAGGAFSFQRKGLKGFKLPYWADLVNSRIEFISSTS